MKSVKRIEPCIYIISAFVVDLFILVYGTLRRLTLPTRNKKGNLLSSLFHLFTELAERLICLKQELIRAPWTCGKKHIRFAMLVLTWALFLLASFEWTGLAPGSGLPVSGQQTSTNSNTIPTGNNAPSDATVKSTAFSLPASPLPASDSHSRSILNNLLANTAPASSPQKQWLLLRKLQI